jgi:F-type H+-transporting ATPase subunit b
MQTHSPTIKILLRIVASVLLLGLVAGIAFAQETGNAPEARAEQSSDQKDSKQNEHPGFAARLAKQEREASGEEEDKTGQFKRSGSVRLLAKLTGGDLERAYWLAMLLNFAVVAAIVLWAGSKFLPGAFRARTAAIQKAMEEARQASEDANRRLTEIESRLARLGDEIASMKAAGEADLTAEEARIKAAAEEDARKIVAAAEQEIAAASKAARRDLTAYAADLAIGLAKKQIHVDAGTDSTLVRSFADRLSGAEGGGKN